MTDARADARANARRGIVVFGDVIDDTIVVPTGAVRNDDDTTARILSRPGGSAGNTAAWLGSLGADVTFIGRVGRADVERHRGEFERFGVHTVLESDDELPTGAVVVLVHETERTMFTQRGANSVASPDTATDALLESAAVLHLSAYSLFGARDLPPFRRLVERATAHGAHVSIDPGSAGFLDQFGRQRLLDLVRGAHIALPNLDEGRALTGRHDPADVARSLTGLFPVIALKLRDGGCLVATAANPEPALVPAPRVEAVDTTGAGDSFAAGFLAEWVRSQDAMAAARAAVDVAGRAVCIIGGRPA